VLLVAFGGLTFALARGVFLGMDVDVYHWVEAHRPPVMYWLARGLNYLGQGSPLTVLAAGIAGLLAWRRHSVRPLLPVVGAYLLTGFTILPLKILFHRAPPHNQNGVAHPEQLFSDVNSQSYPSGHAANAIIWYGVLALLLAGLLTPRLRQVLRIVPPVLVCLCTTYLGYHWLTDTIAGLLLGILLERTLVRVPWNRVPLGRRLTAAGWAGPWPRAAPAIDVGLSNAGSGRSTPPNRPTSM
jgi:membrane-associated phospholipid phosphatase